MQKITLISMTGILTALIVAVLIGTAGSQGSVLVAGWPLFALCGIASFTVNWLVFIPAWIKQTEHFFDLTGSLTYLSLIGLVLLTRENLDMRTLLIAALVGIWAVRLGSFLFMRVKKDGFDRRFTKMKTIFWQFLMTWTLQGLWVFITLSAALAAMTSATPVALDVFAVVGALLWLTGFVIEVVADNQKSAFRADPANNNQFINVGLWSWSRHPNYFGEILLWMGIALIALPVLSGWQYATLISPIFVFVLLNYISGVRMLEVRAERQWGEDPAYQQYKAATPALIPMPPR